MRKLLTFMIFVTSFGFIYSQNKNTIGSTEEETLDISDIRVSEWGRNFHANGTYSIRFSVEYTGGYYLTTSTSIEGEDSPIYERFDILNSCMLTSPRIEIGKNAQVIFTAYNDDGSKTSTYEVEYIPNSTLKTTEINRVVNNEKGVFSIEFLSELPGDSYIYEYTYEQNGIPNRFLWGLSPALEYVYIGLDNLKMNETTKVFIKSYFEGYFITFVYEIPPVVPMDISTDQTEVIIPSKIMVFGMDGKCEGTFESYSSLETSTLIKGIYLIKELDDDNRIIRTKKHIIN